VDQFELMQFVAALYAFMPAVSDYRVPNEMPQVHAVPRTVLQDLVCSRPCRVRAFYHPDFGLLIDDTLDIAGNLYDRSILFHELVHHAQHVNGRFEELRSVCEARAASEGEAYGLQNRYLAANGAGESVPMLNWSGLCRKQDGRVD
jgi:hypothetical protein